MFTGGPASKAIAIAKLALKNEVKPRIEVLNLLKLTNE
jgi:hypothetical protein